MVFSAERGRLLEPLDRISEILFGLIMAVTIVGALSVADAGRADVRTALAAALGCNLAWGLVDAVMYVVRTVADRARNRELARRVAAADATMGQQLIARALPEDIATLAGAEGIEAMRRRLVAGPGGPDSLLGREDFVAALAIFGLVVLATFPVVLPFILIADAPLAMNVSRGVTVAMLFIAGYALGRYGLHEHPLRTGIFAALFGVALIVAVMALGG